MAKSNDTLQNYADDVEFVRGVFTPGGFNRVVNEISTYLEMTYGIGEKQKFLSLIVDNDGPERQNTLGKMRAYLLCRINI
jgi:hypothetical protein